MRKSYICHAIESWAYLRVRCIIVLHSAITFNSVYIRFYTQIVEYRSQKRTAFQLMCYTVARVGSCRLKFDTDAQRAPPSKSSLGTVDG